jgi:hypothetical protein
MRVWELELYGVKKFYVQTVPNPSALTFK